MNEPNYKRCACQHCGGHIKFDANQLKSGETIRIECPHCHRETIIENKSDGLQSTISEESVKHAPTTKKTKSSKIELFFFELTRFPTIAGAILILIACITTAALVVETRIPEKPITPPVVSYDSVAPVQKITTDNNVGFVPHGPKMASKTSFPEPVVSFLLKHQGFTLKDWINPLNPEERRAFLNNLAAALTTANSKGLANDEMEQLVKDFGELWISSLNREKLLRAEKIAEKQLHFKNLVTVGFELFISLMTLTLVLVLLAIERNTRLNVSQKAD